MAYFLDLFTPETWHAFCEMGATVTGFRDRQRRLALEHVHPGDIFLCYVTRVSRWSGVLQVESAAYQDDSPIHDDFAPFTIRFKVKPIVVLEFKMSIPIYDDKVWNTLTITKQHERGIRGWTGFFRSSLNQLDESDGRYLVDLLKGQKANPERYPLTDKDKRQLARRRKVPTLAGEVEVEVPDKEDDDSTPETTLAKPARISTRGNRFKCRRRSRRSVLKWGLASGCQGVTGRECWRMSRRRCTEDSLSYCLLTTTTRRSGP